MVTTGSDVVKGGRSNIRVLPPALADKIARGEEPLDHSSWKPPVPTISRDFIEVTNDVVENKGSASLKRSSANNPATEVIDRRVAKDISDLIVDKGIKTRQKSSKALGEQEEVLRKAIRSHTR